MSSGAKGSLRVGTVPMPAIPFLPVAINRLIDEHPGIFVSVVEERETELLDRLRKRDIEVAILRLALIEPGDDLQVAPLFDEKLCVVASQDHPLAARTPPELARVAGAALGHAAGGLLLLRARAALARPAGHAACRAQTIETMSIQMQFGMVLHAGMLCFGMRSQISFAPGKEFLVRLPFDLPVEGSVVGAVTLKSHEPSPLAQQLIAHIRDAGGASRRHRCRTRRMPMPVAAGG